MPPQVLDGLAEKVDQVARSIPDPALNVITQEIPTDADRARGYLLVHVPVSPQAPHMVDGVYQGRNDKTKIRLTDAEVARLHRLRRSADQDVLALLQQEIEQDPLAGFGQQSHLFLVAQPLTARRDMLMELVSGPGWNVGLANFLQEAYEPPALNAALQDARANPEIAGANTGYRVAGGAARATSHALAPGRLHAAQPGSYGEQDALEVQVLENGGLRLYSSHLSDTDGPDPDTDQWLFDASVVGLTRRFVALTLAAAEFGGYSGNWSLAVGLTRLHRRGPYSGRPGSFSYGSTARYSQDVYQEATGTTWAELHAGPGSLTRRLVGPFLRALDVEAGYSKALADPTSPESTS